MLLVFISIFLAQIDITIKKTTDIYNSRRKIVKLKLIKNRIIFTSLKYWKNLQKVQFKILGPQVQNIS